MKKNLLFLIGAVVLVAAGFFLMSQKYQGTQKSVAVSVAAIASSELVKFHSPSMGPQDSKVLMVEFLDPECEACRAVDPYVKGLVKEFNIHYVVRYAPFHKNAPLAVALLEEARAQGKYWEALSTLFHHQPQWGDHHNPQPQLMREFLKKLDVKIVGTDAELLEKHKSIIETDLADAAKLGVNQTPTFFVNGRKMDRIDYETLKRAIEEGLKIQ